MKKKKKKKNVILSTRAIGPKPVENRVGMEERNPVRPDARKAPKENSINRKSVVFRCSQGDGHQLLDRRRRWRPRSKWKQKTWRMWSLLLVNVMIKNTQNRRDLKKEKLGVRGRVPWVRRLKEPLADIYTVISSTHFGCFNRQPSSSFWAERIQYSARRAIVFTTPFACFLFCFDFCFCVFSCSSSLHSARVSCVYDNWQETKQACGQLLLAGSFRPCSYTRPLYYSFLCLLLFFCLLEKAGKRREWKKKKKVRTHLFLFVFLRLARAPSHTCNGHSALRARTDPNIASSWPSKCKIKNSGVTACVCGASKRKEWNRNEKSIYKNKARLIIIWQQQLHHPLTPVTNSLPSFTPDTAARWQWPTRSGS